MRVDSRGCSFAGLAFIVAALATFSPLSAAITKSAHLAAGETTPDGKITLIVVKLPNAELGLSLRNHGVHPVMIDTISASGGLARECFGTRLYLRPAATAPICDVPDPSIDPSQTTGYQSLQVTLRWHDVRPPAADDSPSPMPSPTES